MSGNPPARPETVWLGRVAILTGRSGCGKTSACRRLAYRAMVQGMSCGGLFCPARFDADRKIAIDVVDVRDGERHPLAALSGGPDAIVLGPWRFDPAATAWARARLERACPCDLLLVDEIGPLEMDRGQGWPSALDVLRSGDYGVAVVVVRPSLVDAVRGALSAGRCVTPIAGSGPRFVADALAAVLAPWSG